MSSSIVASIYQQVINDVIRNIQRDFEDSGVDISVLQELQQLWETKIIQSRVTNFPPEDEKSQLYENEVAETNAKKSASKQRSKPRAGSANQSLSPGNPDADESEDDLSDVNSAGSGRYPETDAKFGGQNAASLASIINTSNINASSGNTGYSLSPSQRNGHNFDKEYDEDQDSSSGDDSQNEPLSTRAPQYLSSNANVPLASISSILDQRGSEPTQNSSTSINNLLNSNHPGARYPHQSYNEGRNAGDNSYQDNKPYLPQNDGSEDPMLAWKKFSAARREAYVNNIKRQTEADTGEGITLELTQVDGDNSGVYGDYGDDEDVGDDAINSDLDDSDDEIENGGDITEHMVLCQYDKVSRTKNKWKCVLKDGIMLVNGRNYLFHKANGDFEW